MEVRDIMTASPEYILATSTISEAAKKMKELNTGFLPIGDKTTDKLVGTLTDRDIVTSALANNKDLNTPVEKIMHKGVFYCYENDDIKKATQCMQKNQIRRLIVLNKNKRLAGILSLGDVALHYDDQAEKSDTLEEISKH